MVGLGAYLALMVGPRLEVGGRLVSRRTSSCRPSCGCCELTAAEATVWFSDWLLERCGSEFIVVCGVSIVHW